MQCGNIPQRHTRKHIHRLYLPKNIHMKDVRPNHVMPQKRPRSQAHPKDTPSDIPKEQPTRIRVTLTDLSASLFIRLDIEMEPRED